MSSARSRRYAKSGSTRSMPSWSGVGNISPVSTTAIEPSYSTTVMFFPISPSPPSGRTRRGPLISDRAEQPVALEHGADRALLLLGRLDEREPQPADVVAQHVQGRLERDRAGAEAHQRVDHVRDLLVDLPASVGLVDHPAHLVADHVRA